MKKTVRTTAAAIAVAGGLMMAAPAVAQQTGPTFSLRLKAVRPEPRRPSGGSLSPKLRNRLPLLGVRSERTSRQSKTAYRKIDRNFVSAV